MEQYKINVINEITAKQNDSPTPKFEVCNWTITFKSIYDIFFSMQVAHVVVMRLPLFIKKKSIS